jgi:hypothetical protein
MKVAGEPHCPVCHVPFTQHLGVIGTCQELNEARCRSEPMSVRDFRSEYPTAEWGNQLLSPEEMVASELE